MANQSTDCTVAQPTPEQAEVRDRIVAAARAARNRILALDLSDAAARSFLVDTFGGQDHLADHFPQMLATIDKTGRAHAADGPARVTLLEAEDPELDKWYPYVNLTYVTLDHDGVTAIAQGLVTLPGAATSVDVNLKMVDNTTGATIADVTLPTQFNTSTQQINASGTISDPANVSVTATLTANFVPAGSEVAVPVVVAFDLSANLVQSVTVLNPNHDNHPQRDYIKVGLNRSPQNQPDCDYWYNYGTDGPKPIVGLLVNGYATLVSGISLSATPGFSGQCILQRQSLVGDGATLAFPADQIPNLCGGSGSTVTWNIGADWFQGAPWDQGDRVDLDFLLNFNVTPGGSTFIRVTSVPAVVSFTPPTNIGKVAPIMFVWGCIAAGTRVDMAGGGALPIEQVRAGDHVRGPDGARLRVRETWIGRETQPLVRLATADGAAALVTIEHPVLTADGVRQAQRLAVGDLVRTAIGLSPLVEVERAGFDGAVHNLDLVPDGEQWEAIDDDRVTAFFAGGLAVGDNRMQGVHSARALDERNARDPLDVLPAEWRLDIANARRLAAGRPLLKAAHA